MPNISNKSKDISGVDRVEQFMQRRNVEVSLSYHVIVVTLEEHMSYCVVDTYVTFAAVLLSHWLKEWVSE